MLFFILVCFEKILNILKKKRKKNLLHLLQWKINRKNRLVLLVFPHSIRIPLYLSFVDPSVLPPSI